jgi:DUF4097 and DUF4098 domain-containing protein YvlB
MPTFATPEPIVATIDVIAGDVRIIADDRTDTVVEVRARDDANDLDAKTAAQTRVEFGDGKLTVKSPKPPRVYFGWKSAAVDVTVRLPAGSRVHVTTAQGDILCRGVLGDCAVRTYDGDIALHQVGGLRATTMNGRVTVDRIAGDAHVTGSGEVMLAEVGGAASVKNLNGPSWIGQAGGDVRLGHVARGSAVLQTASGEIEIGIRHGTAAWLDVKSSSGSIRNHLELGGAPDGSRETAQIRARTFDGDIVVRRAA